MQGRLDLAGKIYEAALEPELWELVLAGMKDLLTAITTGEHGSMRKKRTAFPANSKRLSQRRKGRQELQKQPRISRF